MKITFVTRNDGKFNQAKALFSQAGIELEQAKMDYPEDNDSTIQEIAKNGAKFCANKLQKPVFVDDTGIFFNSYPGFPGPHSKSAYLTLKFEGLFKLLENKTRTGYFLTALAYCEPGKEPILFEGKMNGAFIEEKPEDDNTQLPYEVIFMPKGHNKVLRDFTQEEKETRLIHHRITAFKRLIDYLKK